MQAVLDTLTIKVFEGNPIPVNVVLMLDAFLVGTGLVIFVWWRGRVWGKAWWKRDEEDRAANVGAGAPVAPVAEREALLRDSNDDTNREYGSVT